MRNLKRGLASLLTLVMLLSTLPLGALAAEAEDLLPSEDLPLADEVIVAISALDIVFTVTSDVEKASDAEGGYNCFDGDGSYTMILPAETEFPLAVKFTWQGKDTICIFGSETESNQIGDHSFKISLEEAKEAREPEDPVFPEVEDGVSVSVGREQVPLVLSDGPALLSMMPLPVRYYTLDLTSYFPDELKSVDISDVLRKLAPLGSGSTVQSPDKVAAWAKWGYYDEEGNYVSENDDYTIVGDDKTLDFTTYQRYSSNIQLELIIGTADPLNKSNTRYIIQVYTSSHNDLLEIEAYTTARSKIEIYDAYSYEDRNSGTILQMGVNPATWREGQEAYLSMNLNSQYTGLTARVYEGRYETAEALTSANEITGQIWAQQDMVSSGGYRADCTYRNGYTGMPVVTLALTRNSTGKIVQVLPLTLYMFEDGMSLSYSHYLYVESQGSSRRTNAGRSWSSSYKNGFQELTVTLRSGLSANETCYFNLHLHNPASENNGFGLQYVKKAVIGNYQSETAIPAGAVDIKDQLFSDASGSGGYGTDYSNGVIFTVVDTAGGLHRFGLKTIAYEEPDELPPAPRPMSADTYFQMNGAKSSNGAGLNAYTMPYDSDSYYYNGFQTVFLLDSSNGPVSGEISPTFWTGSRVEMFAGLDKDGQQAGAVKQISGESKITFENGKAIPYSAAAENDRNLKNYWVTFVTKQPGKALFVNGINDESRKDPATGYPIREMVLTEEYDNHHDVFFANIGSEPLTNLKVELQDAQGIALDDYWRIGDTKTLDAFTTTKKTQDHGELSNVAKIRIVPAETEAEAQTGETGGILVISADGVEPVRIKLTAITSGAKITTQSVRNGIKYVHYSSLIQTNNMYGSNRVRFALSGGSLPDGMELKENGELYGVPTQAGTFTFTATATYSDGTTTDTDSKSFTFTIAENTNENVESVNGDAQGYALQDRIPDQSGTVSDQIFRSAGEFGEFMNVYLDGRPLTSGRDYTAESGSTKITVQAQTMRNAGNGTHTISAEFRSGGSEQGTMKRTAQNFTISGVSGGGSSSSGGGGGSRPSSSGSSRPSSRPSTTKPAAPSTPTVEPVKTTADIFQDISTNHWFYPDVDWAYQNKLMVGVDASHYQPYGTITQPTVVTVLSRLNKIDLTAWNDNIPEEIPAGQWYSAAAAWAKSANLLPEGSFNAQDPMRRGEMAVMLQKYLMHLDIDCTLPATPVAFADAAEMTREENDAFQVLYQFGIFKGVGNYKMDVSGSTTRAQFAVLLHRLSVFVAAHQTEA